MLTSKRFTSSFGMLASISRLVVGLALGLTPSCALEDPAATADSSASADDATDATEDGLTDSVCSSGRFRCHAHVRVSTDRAGRRITAHAATPTGFGPADLQSAYKIDPAVTAALKPTVAIIDAYGYTALESDLAMYRSYYNLPPCSIANGCLKVVNQQGQATPLPPNPPANDDWTVETALDIDMVSAACPKCNILVVQAQDNAGDGLYVAQNAAASLGATVISNSWGGPEQANTPPATITMSEAYFNHPNIAIFVSAGDDGYNDGGQGPDYPGTSAYAIAVGGTRLVRDATTTRGWTETAWTSGGSACSLAIAKPAYQTASPCGFKATTDIAAVGDPATGLAVFNAKNGGWITVGGTSASSPFVAAIFAATGNGTQTSGAFIASKASKLYDVTTGNNGTCGTQTLLCNAAAGWDGPTGYGTPNAMLLMPAGTGSGPGTGTGTGTGGGSGGGAKDGTGAGDGPALSGGCSTSTGGTGGAGVLLGVALLGLRRRRAR
jgi:MYXO-CTERM domain-containing protein